MKAWLIWTATVMITLGYTSGWGWGPATPEFGKGMCFASAMMLLAAAIEEAGWFK